MPNRTEKEPIPARDILRDLSYAKPMIATLKNSGKAYDALIDEIIAFSEDVVPSSKSLQQKLNIKPAKLNAWINELHNDFIHHIQLESTEMTFQTMRVGFGLTGSAENIFFYCRIPFLPRIGEKVEFPFIRSIVGHESFYVDHIAHELKGGEDEVYIHASTNEPFVENLMQRAIFEQEIDIFTASKMSSFELKKFLRGLYGPASGGQAAHIQPGHPLWRKQWGKNR